MENQSNKQPNNNNQESLSLLDVVNLDKLGDVPVIGDIFCNKSKVAVIRMSGVISDTAVRKNGISHTKYTKTIEKALSIKKLGALALVINSPGGSPAQASLIASHIKRLARKKEIPVYTFVEDVAVSGGYWLACAADEIYAQESSIIGSVGVISAGFGFEDFIEKYNVHRRVYTAGKDKSFMDPFSPEKDSDVEKLRSIQEKIHAGFIKWVKERRGEVLKGDDTTLFEGNFWTGEQAIELGLIDGIGEMHEILQEKYGESIRFVEIKTDRTWYQQFLGSKADWVNELITAIEDRTIWSKFGL